jgi:hypothetical protein
VPFSRIVLAMLGCVVEIGLSGGGQKSPLIGLASRNRGRSQAKAKLTKNTYGK